jgi:hypothetical protein
MQGCGHPLLGLREEYLRSIDQVTFSYKQKCACPSCHQKRTLMTGIHRPSLRSGARGRCLFSRCASASSLHHPQMFESSRTFRQEASRQTFLLCLELHQGRSQAYVGPARCRARHDCGHPDIWPTAPLESAYPFSFFLRYVHP